jgi:hypothetical protein
LHCHVCERDVAHFPLQKQLFLTLIHGCEFFLTLRRRRHRFFRRLFAATCIDTHDTATGDDVVFAVTVIAIVVVVIAV